MMKRPNSENDTEMRCTSHSPVPLKRQSKGQLVLEEFEKCDLMNYILPNRSRLNNEKSERKCTHLLQCEMDGGLLHDEIFVKNETDEERQQTFDNSCSICSKLKDEPTKRIDNLTITKSYSSQASSSDFCEKSDDGQCSSSSSGYSNSSSGYRNSSSGYRNSSSGYENSTSGSGNSTSGFGGSTGSINYSSGASGNSDSNEHDKNSN